MKLPRNTKLIVLYLKFDLPSKSSTDNFRGAICTSSSDKTRKKTECYLRLVYEKKMILKMKYEENLFFSKPSFVLRSTLTDKKTSVIETKLCVLDGEYAKKERKVPQMVYEYNVD